MLVELPHEARGDSTTVGATVEGEVVPGVRIPLPRSRRQVRWIRYDPVEAPQAAGKVRSDRCQVEPFGAGPLTEASEGMGVEVSRHHSSAAPSRLESHQTGARPNFEESSAGADEREREKEKGVFPRWVDRPPSPRASGLIVPAVGRWTLGTMASYWLQAYNLTCWYSCPCRVDFLHPSKSESPAFRAPEKRRRCCASSSFSRKRA